MLDVSFVLGYHLLPGKESFRGCVILVLGINFFFL